MNNWKPLLLIFTLFSLISLYSCKDEPEILLTIQERLDAGESPQSLYIDLSLSPSSLIGKEYLGGIIIFINRSKNGSLIVSQSEDFGIVSAKEVLGPAPWGCEGTLIGTYPGLGFDGAINTTAILTNCNQTGIAARLVDAYSIDSFNDWNLPNARQLRETINAIVELGYPPGYYFSSSEWNQDQVWSTTPYTSDILQLTTKSDSNYVLPMKLF